MFETKEASMSYKFLTILTVMCIAGCGTMLDYQDQCAELHNSFEAEVKCWREKSSADPRSKGNQRDLVELYLNTADYLATQVSAGTRTEQEARLLMSQLYVELKNMQSSREVAQLQKTALWNSIYAPPQSVTCTTIGNTTTCK